MNAQQLIYESTQHNTIAHGEYSEDLAMDLLAECEDSVEGNDGEHQYWGTTDSGSEWRVHLSK